MIRAMLRTSAGLFFTYALAVIVATAVEGRHLSGISALYALCRIAAATAIGLGLWHGDRWAQWLAALFAGLFGAAGILAVQVAARPDIRARLQHPAVTLALQWVVDGALLTALILVTVLLIRREPAGPIPPVM